VNSTQSACSANQFGFDVCLESGSFSGPMLGNGTYWLDLENAVVNDGVPVFWDENGGPSEASNNSVGTLPAESFTLLGTPNGTGSVPKPGSQALVGSRALWFAGTIRRKLF
jgi:hypothetical protein